jgi:hypothetical protein
MLEFQFTEVFKLQLRIKMESGSNLGVGRQHEALERKRVVQLIERVVLEKQRAVTANFNTVKKTQRSLFEFILRALDLLDILVLTLFDL